jgi:cell division protein ZapB
MEIIETLNSKIDKLIHDYEKLRLENQALLQELDKIKNDNDELVRNNQDMFLRIDSTLTLIKAQTGE